MQAFSVLLLGLVAMAANAHTIVSSPRPRENSVHTTGSAYQCGGDTGVAATYGRGDVVPMEWGRNNHATGFVQVSILPTGGNVNTVSMNAQFDDPSNIVRVMCYGQRSCRPPNPDKFGLGGDGVGFQQLMCKNSVTIPTYLPDGEYVMKTSIFGNGDSFGIRNMPHHGYSNCHNMRISGGAGVTTKPGDDLHIDFAMQDDNILIVNDKTGSNIAQGQCVFHGTNTHMGCKPPSGKAPTCSGDVADMSRCGSGTYADSRQDCLSGGGGYNSEGQTEGGNLFNYMVGRPPYHPDYNGVFTVLSHVRGHQVVTAPGFTNPPRGGSPTDAPTFGPDTPTVTGGGDTGGGGNGGGGTTSCESNGNCVSNPNCCGQTGACVEKDQYWAVCMSEPASCVPGVHNDDPAAYRTPWSCKNLGDPRTPCAANGNCVDDPDCCGNSGVCMEKDQYWAVCMSEPSRCRPGLHNDDPVQYRTPWSCDVLGRVSAIEDNFYKWVPGEWTMCSEPCGGGIHTRSMGCVDSDGKAADNFLCEANTGHEALTRMICNVDDCDTYKWVEGTFGTECSKDCAGGVQRRTNKCVAESTGSEVDASSCEGQAPPAAEQPCNADVVCEDAIFYWVASPWSATCEAASCTGKQTRDVSCQKGDGTPAADADCTPANKPSPAQDCTEPCPTFEWKACAWGECTAQCGGPASLMTGMQSRQEMCQDADGKLVDASLCDPTTSETVKAGCNSDTKCTGFNWMTTEWGPCLDGQRSRTAHCHAANGGNALKEDCPAENEPALEKSCEAFTCDAVLDEDAFAGGAGKDTGKEDMSGAGALAPLLRGSFAVCSVLLSTLWL